MKIVIENRPSYGEDRYYPVDDNAKRFAKLADTKTLTRFVLKIIKDLGYEIELKQNSVVI